MELFPFSFHFLLLLYIFDTFYFDLSLIFLILSYQRLPYTIKTDLAHSISERASLW